MKLLQRDKKESTKRQEQLVAPKFDCTCDNESKCPYGRGYTVWHLGQCLLMFPVMIFIEFCFYVLTFFSKKNHTHTHTVIMNVYALMPHSSEACLLMQMLQYILDYCLINIHSKTQAIQSRLLTSAAIWQIVHPRGRRQGYKLQKYLTIVVPSC